MSANKPLSHLVLDEYLLKPSENSVTIFSDGLRLVIDRRRGANNTVIAVDVTAYPDDDEQVVANAICDMGVLV